MVSDVVTPPLVATVPAEPLTLSSTLKDLVALGKPGITSMAAIVGAGTWLLAAPSLDPSSLLRGSLGILGVTLLVMGAGALNMLIERDAKRLAPMYD